MESWSTRSRRRKPPESIYTPLDMSSAGKAKCMDHAPPGLPDTVHVLATGKGDTYFDGEVKLGGTGIFPDPPGTITLTPPNPGDKFASNTIIRISDLGGTRVQTLMVHTSCSKALNLDDQFGGLLVVDMVAN